MDISRPTVHLSYNYKPCCPLGELGFYPINLNTMNNSKPTKYYPIPPPLGRGRGWVLTCELSY